MEAVYFAFIARSRAIKKQRYSGQPDPKGHAIKIISSYFLGLRTNFVEEAIISFLFNFIFRNCPLLYIAA